MTRGISGRYLPANPFPQFALRQRFYPGESWQRELAARGVPGVPDYFEDWDLVVSGSAGSPTRRVSLGRGSGREWDPPEAGPGFRFHGKPTAAIPSPDGAYAVVRAADNTLRLWTRAALD
jgi:hypothetical protein